MSAGEEVLKLIEHVRRVHPEDAEILQLCDVAARWAAGRIADVVRARKNRDKARAKRRRDERAAAAADRGGA
jgi:hypothetical protein